MTAKLAWPSLLLAGLLWPAAPLAAPVDLAYGAYQRGDHATAMREAQKRVEANPRDAAALSLIGRLYAEGASVPRDAKIAATWFRRAADTGDPNGSYLYGASLLQGKSGVQERKIAKTYLERAAAQNHGAALNLLGEMALDSGDLAGARGFFKRGAEAGDADAAYAMGEMSKHGKGAEKNDAEAARWFADAAKQDHSGALVELAIIKFNVEHDPAAAAELLRKSAKLGNAVAQNRLAYLLARGDGAPRDLAEAEKLRDLARAQGLEDPGLDELLARSGPPLRREAK